MPYTSDQTVKFVNDSQVVTSFLVHTGQQLPPDQYCGSVGSGSYMYCSGESAASLKSVNDSSAMITINNRAGADDAVELYVTNIVFVYNGTISIYRGSVISNDENGNGTNLGNITINGTQYNNVYVYQNNQAEINSCSYFVYSLQKGVLKYTIKKANSSENWVLTN
jgi:hypothetical protein